jgi:hypothetical protein
LFSAFGKCSCVVIIEMMFINTCDNRFQKARGESNGNTKALHGSNNSTRGNRFIPNHITLGIIATQTIMSNGTIATVNVGVYSDRQCKPKLYIN